MNRKELPMLSFDALVRGRVKYDGEQGPGSRVPAGRCTVQAHEGIVSLRILPAKCDNRDDKLHETLNRGFALRATMGRLFK